MPVIHRKANFGKVMIVMTNDNGNHNDDDEHA